MPPTFYDFSLIPIFSLSRYCPTLFNTTILIINGTKYVARRYNNKIDAIDTPLTKSSKTIKNANSAAPIPDTLGNAFAIRLLFNDPAFFSFRYFHYHQPYIFLKPIKRSSTMIKTHMAYQNSTFFM